MIGKATIVHFESAAKVIRSYECEFIAESQFSLRRHLHSAHDVRSGIIYFSMLSPLSLWSELEQKASIPRWNSDDELDRILPMTQDKLDEILDTLERTVSTMVYVSWCSIVATWHYTTMYKYFVFSDCRGEHCHNGGSYRVFVRVIYSLLALNRLIIPDDAP